MKGYAVVWREPDGPMYAGRLDVLGGGVVLDGVASDGGHGQQLVGAEELASAEIERSPRRTHFGGRPALVLQRRSGPPLLVASILGAGILVELRDLIAALPPGAPRAAG